MGFLDSIEGMAKQEMSGGGQNAQAAGGLMQALDQHPGGLAGVLQSFQQNGMGQHVQDMQNGQTTPLTPEQVQQGTQGTGLIESVAEKAGISPEMAKMGMAVALPMIIAHFSQNNGGQMPQQGEFGGMASQILGKFL
jgi:uncharacterized protein YidB (DUF937 family)